MAQTLKSILQSRLTYFSPFSGVAVPFPSVNLEPFEYFVFFVTYPGCGSTCKPIFEDLCQLKSSMAGMGHLPSFLMVNFPFNGGYGEQDFTEYYKENHVSWPWVKLTHRLDVQSAITGYPIGNMCPRLRLVPDGVPPVEPLPPDVNAGSAGGRQILFAELRRLIRGKGKAGMSLQLEFA